MSEGLPEGWAEVTLADVGEIVTGSTPPTKDARLHGGSIPFVKPGDLGGDVPIRDTEDHVTEQGARAGRLLSRSASLVCCIGSLGKVGFLDREAICNQQINAVVPGPAIEPRYLWHSLRVLTSWLEQHSSETTIRIVNKSRFSTAPIRIAPLAEQRRVVVQIEALMAEAGAARARLARVPLILKRFRQAVLAAACSGRLTEDWRVSAPRSSSAATILRTCEVECLPFDLPEGWLSTMVDEVAHLINGDRSKNYPSKEHRVSEGIPFINAGHLEGGQVDLTRMDYITPERFELLRGGKVRERDILYCLRGSLGKAGLVSGISCGAIASSLVIVRVEPTRCLETYLYYYLTSPLGAAMIKQYDNGSAQPNLSAADVGRYALPLPPLAEQAEIVRRVDALFTLATTIEHRLAAATTRADKLPQAILTKAFRGELVPTEADLAKAESRTYETATALLARIRASRTPAPAPNPKRARPKKVPG